MSRLFHALVVFGTTISLPACGGRATDGEVSPDEPGASGGDPSTGGSFGDVGTGGGIEVPEEPPPLPPEPPLPPAEITAQWECSLHDCQNVEYQGLETRAYLVEQANCSANSARPRRPEDCTSDEWFECKLGTTRSGDPVVFDCNCQPQSDDPNCAGCEDPWSGSRATPLCLDQIKLCRCAYTGILR